MFQHFGQRLKRDLKQIVDRRLENTALQSGSHIKVYLILKREIMLSDYFVSPLV